MEGTQIEPSHLAHYKREHAVPTIITNKITKVVILYRDNIEIVCHFTLLEGTPRVKVTYAWNCKEHK